MSRKENDICRDYYFKISMEPTLLLSTETLTESERKKEIERKRQRDRKREREINTQTHAPVCVEFVRFWEEGIVTVHSAQHDPHHPSFPEWDAINFTVFCARPG